MKLVTLVENKTDKKNIKTKHGLAIYVEACNKKILFDLGPDDTLFKNAKKQGINIKDVDIVVISHGHYDHAGSLEKFLNINKKAKVYIQRSAFEKHYFRAFGLDISIGINSELKLHPQIVLLNGDYKIDDNLELFIVNNIEKCKSPSNNAMYTDQGRDDFKHEQNLVIKENKTVLLMGCGHAGVVNIMERAKEYNVDYCIGGYHLIKHVGTKKPSEELFEEIVRELKKYPNARYYTCHCTGDEAFEYMSSRMSNMKYLSCGDILEI